MPWLVSVLLGLAACTPGNYTARFAPVDSSPDGNARGRITPME